MMRRGSLRQTQNFKIRILPNKIGWARLGLVVGKRVGNACVRNSVKRRLREFFRLNRHVFPPGSDVVIIQSGTNNVLAEIDSNPTSSYVYTYEASHSIDIGIIKGGYVPLYIRNYTLPTSDSSFPVAQVVDRNYSS